MCRLGQKTALVAILLLVAGTACKAKPADQDKTASAPSAAASTAALPDLSTSLDAVRGAFNARKHEARFLALLAPT